MRVRFRFLKSRREWEALFDLGSDEENAHAAVTVAWQHNCEILSHEKRA